MISIELRSNQANLIVQNATPPAPQAEKSLGQKIFEVFVRVITLGMCNPSQRWLEQVQSYHSQMITLATDYRDVPLSQESGQALLRGIEEVRDYLGTLTPENREIAGERYFNEDFFSTMQEYIQNVPVERQEAPRRRRRQRSVEAPRASSPELSPPASPKSSFDATALIRRARVMTSQAKQPIPARRAIEELQGHIGNTPEVLERIAAFNRAFPNQQIS